MSSLIQETHALLAQRGRVGERLPFELDAVSDAGTAREFVARRLQQMRDICSAARPEGGERRRLEENATMKVRLDETRAYSSEMMKKLADETLTDASKSRELLFHHVNLIRGKAVPPSEAVVVNDELHVLPDFPYLARLVHGVCGLGSCGPQSELLEVKILRAAQFAISVSGETSSLSLQQAVDSAVATDRKFVRVTGAVLVHAPVTISGSKHGDSLVIQGHGKYASVRATGDGVFALTGNANVVFRDICVIGASGFGVHVRGKAHARFLRCELSGAVAVVVASDANVAVDSCEFARCSEASLKVADTAIVHLDMTTFNGGVEGCVLGGHAFARLSDCFFRDTLKSAIRVTDQAVAKVLTCKLTSCGVETPAVLLRNSGGLSAVGTEISGGEDWAVTVEDGGKFELVDMRISGKSGSLRVSGAAVPRGFRKLVACKLEGPVDLGGTQVVARGCSKELPDSEDPSFN